jgi:hypothetical protein
MKPLMDADDKHQNAERERRFQVPFDEHGTTGSKRSLLLIISGHQCSSAVSTELFIL